MSKENIYMYILKNKYFVQRNLATLNAHAAFFRQNRQNDADRDKVSLRCNL